MAAYTSNYGWAKPSGSDNVDISVLNNNLDDQDRTIHDAFLNMAPPFSESSTYAVDDIVLYGTGLYKCHTAVVTPGSWTGSTNWQVYKLSEGGGTVDEIVENLTASNNVPFRFGYDQTSGKYGYILNQGGADTVIPFSGSGGDNFDPNEYTAYIESDANSWIDTGYKVKDNSRFVIVANVTKPNSRYAVLFGVRSNTSDDDPAGCFMFTNYNGDNRCSVTWGSNRTDIAPQSTSLADYFYGIKSQYSAKKNNVIIDNGDVKTAGLINSQSTVTTAYNLFIFSLNQAGSEYGSITRCLAKLYSFKIYEGENPVMDLVPFMDGNVPCLKDNISGDLFYNAGTGTLTYGEDE